MSAEKKKELQVAALENGTAIDHIPPSQLFKVAKLLGLENMDNTITIGNNFHSNKMGSKGMIKISDKFFCDEEINRIAHFYRNHPFSLIYFQCIIQLPFHQEIGNASFPIWIRNIILDT